MFDVSGFVNFWTEFLVAHVGVLHEYTLEYAETSTAEAVWHSVVDTDALSHHVDIHVWLNLTNYSLLNYLSPQDGLVHRTHHESRLSTRQALQTLAIHTHEVTRVFDLMNKPLQLTPNKSK